MSTSARDLFLRRRRRVRAKLRGVTGERARFSVFRSGRHIYAQLIDDRAGRTLVAASTLEKGVREEVKSGGTIEAAKLVGRLIAERAKAAGHTSVVFDRGGYLFHGRVKALADAARENGLEF